MVQMVNELERIMKQSLSMISIFFTLMNFGYANECQLYIKSSPRRKIVNSSEIKVEVKLRKYVYSEDDCKFKAQELLLDGDYLFGEVGYASEFSKMPFQLSKTRQYYVEYQYLAKN